MKTLFFLALILSSTTIFAQDSGLECAVVYSSEDVNTSSELAVKKGDRIHNLNRVKLNKEDGDWDNKISAMYVKKGCTLTGYQYLNFNHDLNTGAALEGFAQAFTNSEVEGYGYFSLDETLRNKISSLNCTCP